MVNTHRDYSGTTMRDNIGNMNFGTKIKEARTEAGLTQEQLGIRCGWSTGNPQSRIGNYEKNTRNPSAADIAVLAEALNKNILYFYDMVIMDEAHKAEPGQSDYTQARNAAAHGHIGLTATPTQTNEEHGLYMALQPETNQLELLQSVIETVETILVEEDISLTPTEKASAIITCLQTCMKRGLDKSTSPDIAITAIHAIR